MDANKDGTIDAEEWDKFMTPELKAAIEGKLSDTGRGRIQATRRHCQGFRSVGHRQVGRPLKRRDQARSGSPWTARSVQPRQVARGHGH